MMQTALINILGSGFLQDQTSYHGMLDLRENMMPEFSHGATNRVMLLPWNADWKRFALELAIVLRINALKPLINAAGFSYGGTGILRLCHALEPLGIKVDTLTLCDPVTHPWYWPTPLPAITSMLSRDWAYRLKVPSNVREVWSFYQQNNRPQGHRLKCSEPTIEHDPVKVDRIHTRMDDFDGFHERVIANARSLKAKQEAA